MKLILCVAAILAALGIGATFFSAPYGSLPCEGEVAAVVSEQALGSASDEVRTQPVFSERAEAPTPEVSLDAAKIAALESEVAVRDEKITNLEGQIAALRNEIEAMKRERTDRLKDEFRRVAEAQGIDARATNILADRVIPFIGEIPTQWQLQELAVAALEVFPKIDETQLRYGGNMNDPTDRAISLERKALFSQWNTAAERILGFDQARLVRWGA